MIPINCIFFTSSINCLKRNCISKISTVSPQLINYISKSILYLLRVNIASPGNYLEFIPSPLKIYICELVVFDNKFDMNYNYQAKFGVAITKMSKMREIFLIILEKIFFFKLEIQQFISELALHIETKCKLKENFLRTK